MSDKIEFIDIVKKGLSPSMGEKIMTGAELFRLEGRQEGRQEGREEGIRIGEEKVALKLLQRGYSFKEVATVTGIHDSKLELLLNQTEEN